MKGASPVTAIDNDEWAYNNAFTNVALNGIDDLQIVLGDAHAIGDATFDIILANINRNILLRDMPLYVKAMRDSARIFFSGFYTQDLDAIKEAAQHLGLRYERHLSKNNWVAAVFLK